MFYVYYNVLERLYCSVYNPLRRVDFNICLICVELLNGYIEYEWRRGITFEIGNINFKL